MTSNAATDSTTYRVIPDDDHRIRVERASSSTPIGEGRVLGFQERAQLWNAHGRRTLVAEIIGDALGFGRYGTSPIADIALLDRLTADLLPSDDTDTPPVDPLVIDLHTVRTVCRQHWRAIIKIVGVDPTGHRHRWQLVRSTHTVDGTVTTTAHGDPYDSLYEAKQLLRISRRALTREQPEAKARGDRWKLQVLQGTGTQALDPIPADATSLITSTSTTARR